MLKIEKRRKNIHKTIIELIKKQGFEVSTENTTTNNYKEAIEKFESSLCRLPKDDLKRRFFVQKNNRRN